MRVVIALGGNALLQRGQPPDAQLQQENVDRAVAAIAEVARRHEVVVTHGNGPQVGLLSLESERDPALSRPYPLDVIGAETSGMIGYWMARGLGSALPDRAVAALLTQTLVSADDPSFANPTKFVGQLYDEATATRLAQDCGWTVKVDGTGWRRVVPSPEPLVLVEQGVIRQLVDSGVLVICAGGGGVPVVRTAAGYQGVEAVVDKDFAAALLARELAADALVMLTDVVAVQRGFGTPLQSPIGEISVAELRQLDFPAGSMGPKIDAACRFVEASGGFAAIGALQDAARLVSGVSGTIVRNELPSLPRQRHDVAPHSVGVR
jgi:carbamate kinase